MKLKSEACKIAHHKYISTLSNPSDEVISWAQPFQNKITKLTADFSKLMQKKIDAKQSGIPHEKLKMPQFDGNIRNYPRFKGEFQHHVTPKYKNDSQGAAYALKSCLSE